MTTHIQGRETNEEVASESWGNRQPRLVHTDSLKMRSEFPNEVVEWESIELVDLYNPLLLELSQGVMFRHVSTVETAN